MQTTTKKSSKFTKKTIHVDDMMIHNIVKYLVQTRLRLWEHIPQTKSSLDKIFYNVVYHHIIYMSDFLVNLDDFFVMVYTGFHKNCGLHYLYRLANSAAA